MRTPSGAKLDARRLLAVAACVALGVVFWDSPFLKPLKLLVVMMHESGHALAALLVGGSVEQISIATDQSGQCLSRLPDSVFGQIFVYSAGYVGSALAGGALLLATLRFNLRRWVLAATCVWLLVMGFFYGHGDAFTFFFCLVTAAAMGAGAKWLPEGAVDVVNLFIAAFSGLYVVFDVRDDLWTSTRGASDAALLADLSYVPAILWAAIWTVAALAVLGGAVWIAVQPTRKAARLARRGVQPLV